MHSCGRNTYLRFLKLEAACPDAVVTHQFGLFQAHLNHVAWQFYLQEFLQDYRMVLLAIQVLMDNGANARDFDIDMITADFDLDRA